MHILSKGKFPIFLILPLVGGSKSNVKNLKFSYFIEGFPKIEFSFLIISPYQMKEEGGGYWSLTSNPSIFYLLLEVY